LESCLDVGKTCAEVDALEFDLQEPVDSLTNEIRNGAPAVGRQKSQGSFLIVV
jgi:hypothetical protein